jgi:hypothetical protein
MAFLARIDWTAAKFAAWLLSPHRRLWECGCRQTTKDGKVPATVIARPVLSVAAASSRRGGSKMLPLRCAVSQFPVVAMR